MMRDKRKKKKTKRGGDLLSFVSLCVCVIGIQKKWLDGLIEKDLSSLLLLLLLLLLITNELWW